LTHHLIFVKYPPERKNLFAKKFTRNRGLYLVFIPGFLVIMKEPKRKDTYYFVDDVTTIN